MPSRCLADVGPRSGPWPALPGRGPDRVSAVPETASWLHRIGALFVDWFVCILVAQGAIAFGLIEANPNGFGTLALFILESTVLTAWMGGSFGKLVTRLRVVRADGS